MSILQPNVKDYGLYIPPLPLSEGHLGTFALPITPDNVTWKRFKGFLNQTISC